MGAKDFRTAAHVRLAWRWTACRSQMGHVQLPAAAGQAVDEVLGRGGGGGGGRRRRHNKHGSRNHGSAVLTLLCMPMVGG